MMRIVRLHFKLEFFLTFVGALERQNMVKSSYTTRRHGKAMYLFQIHSHIPEVQCLICHQTDKNSLPNGIICFLTIGIDKVSEPNIKYASEKNKYKFEMTKEKDPIYLRTFREKESFIFKPESFMPCPQTSSIIPRNDFDQQHPLNLRNRRNDCFGNAVIQSLLHLDAVKDLLKEPLQDDVVLIELKKLSENRKNFQSIAAFMNAIARINPLMNDMQQHDASLFLQLLIEMSPALMKLFEFNSVITDECFSCNNKTKRSQLNHFGLLDFNQPSFKKMFFEHDQKIEIEKDCATPQCLKKV